MQFKNDYPLRRYLRKQIIEEWEDDPSVVVFEGRIEFFMNKPTSKEIQVTSEIWLPEENITKADFINIGIFAADGVWVNYLADGYKEVDKDGKPIVPGLKRIKKSRFQHENERLQREERESTLTQEEWEQQLLRDSLASGPSQEEQELINRGWSWVEDYEDWIGENSNE